MCFNAEVSITTYIISLVFSVYILTRKGATASEKTIAVFCICFCQMQLLEFFLWINQECNLYNHITTILVEFFLILQPISIILAGIMYKSFKISQKFLRCALVLYALPLVMNVYFITHTTSVKCSIADVSGHLNWDIIEIPAYHVIYTIGIMLPWIFLKQQNLSLLMCVFVWGTYLFSRLNFKEWESMWCFIATIIPMIIVIK